MPLPIETEAEFCDLLKDIKRGKKKHFEAARRKNWAHFALGITALFVSAAAAVIGSLADVSQTADALRFQHATVLVSAASSVLVGLITFLRLEKTVEGQRAVANSYQSMFRDARAHLAMARDGKIDEAGFLQTFDKLRSAYHALNREAEPFTVGVRASRAAKAGDEDFSPVASRSPTPPLA